MNGSLPRVFLVRYTAEADPGRVCVSGGVEHADSGKSARVASPEGLTRSSLASSANLRPASPLVAAGDPTSASSPGTSPSPTGEHGLR